MSGLIHYRQSDGLNNQPVSLANPLPVTQVGVDGSTAVSATNPVPVVPRGTGYTVAVSLTRTADTNAYSAGDVVGAATGATAALTFASMGPSGGDILITSAEFEVDAAALITGQAAYTLYLYNVTPPSALGDNASWDLPSGDRASFLGSINLGTPVDLGSTLYISTDGVNKHIKLASGSLFAYLVTVGAYTPASATVHKITLHAIGL